jgi:microcystin-dependent protein
MKKLRILATVTAMIALPYVLPAQVGINTTTPDSSAVLHIHHLLKGVLLPTVDADARETIVSATDVANGLLIYDTLQKLYYFRDTESKNWIVLNPLRVSEQESAPWGDIRLADSYRQRNVYIGINDAAIAQAKLHVEGTLMADSAATLKQSLSVGTSATISETLTVNTSITTPAVTSNQITSDTVTAILVKGYGTTPLGGIIMWSGTEIPDGWALCNGQTVNAYKTPDLRGRFVVGYGASSITHGSGDVPANVWDKAYCMPGDLSQKGTKVGSAGGEKEVTLTIDQMPVHTHPPHPDTDGEFVFTYASRGSLHKRGLDSGESSGKYLETGPRGGDKPHENRPPYYVLAYIMRVK